MSDGQQHPDAERNHKPQNQTDESKGNITSRQVTDQEMQRKDLARGSEPDIRRKSGNRSS